MKNFSFPRAAWEHSQGAPRRRGGRRAAQRGSHAARGNQWLSPFRAFSCFSWALLLLLAGCVGSGTSVSDPAKTANAGWTWTLPATFPTPAVPADNPMSEEKFQLGRRLFYDKRLSVNGTTACASCHLQSLAFTDGKSVSTGATGQHTPRGAMTIANSAYHPTLTWARPDLTSLEMQALVPIYGTNPIELGLTAANEPTILQTLAADPDYAVRFPKVFPTDAQPVTIGNIVKAIAAFERGVISGGAKFDLYLAGQATLSASELNGYLLFNSEKAECFHCHADFNFNDQVTFAGARGVVLPFHNTGLYDIDGMGGYPAPNRGVFEKSGNPADMGAFRAPSLRNVGVTAPYMHDGSIATLEAVVATYAAGGRLLVVDPFVGSAQLNPYPAGTALTGDGRLSPFKNPLITNINLTAQEQSDLVAFLHTLTDSGLLTNPRYADPFVVVP